MQYCNMPYSHLLKQSARKSASSGETPAGTGGPPLAWAIWLKAAKWFSVAGQGCLPAHHMQASQPIGRYSMMNVLRTVTRILTGQ